jgi:hypothetical protein
MTDAFSVMPGVVCTPGAHLSEDRLETFTALGKRVLHLWRDNLVNLPPKQTVCLQLAKLLGQHLLTGLGNQAPELTEPEDLVRFDIIEQQRFVLPAYYRQRDFHGTKNWSLWLFSIQWNARLQKGA